MKNQQKITIPIKNQRKNHELIFDEFSKNSKCREIEPRFARDFRTPAKIRLWSPAGVLSHDSERHLEEFWESLG